MGGAENIRCTVGGKHLKGIKTMHIKSLAYVQVTGCESDSFRIHSGGIQDCIMSR